MAVNLYGLPVGSVKTMLISDRGVKVELSIVSDYLAHVPKGSHARLLREGYIGAANIQIVPSADPPRGAGPIVAGESIEFIPNRGVAGYARRRTLCESRRCMSSNADSGELSWLPQHNGDAIHRLYHR